MKVQEKKINIQINNNKKPIYKKIKNLIYFKNCHRDYIYLPSIL